MATQTRNLTVTFLLHNGIKQPEMEEIGHFYKKYIQQKKSNSDQETIIT